MGLLPFDEFEVEIGKLSAALAEPVTTITAAAAIARKMLRR
ncbi:hypothetical protein [Jezberella montanilacus]|nr:hypothetical protein [Jezberella montanilacus]